MLRRVRGLFLSVAGERRRLPSVVHRRRPHRRAFLRLDQPPGSNLGNLLPPRRTHPHPLARPPDRREPTHVPRPLPNHPPRVQERRDDLRLLDRPQTGLREEAGPKTGTDPLPVGRTSFREARVRGLSPFLGSFFWPRPTFLAFLGR